MLWASDACPSLVGRSNLCWTLRGRRSRANLPYRGQTHRASQVSLRLPSWTGVALWHEADRRIESRSRTCESACSSSLGGGWWLARAEPSWPSRRCSRSRLQMNQCAYLWGIRQRTGIAQYPSKASESISSIEWPSRIVSGSQRYAVGFISKLSLSSSICSCAWLRWHFWCV